MFCTCILIFKPISASTEDTTAQVDRTPAVRNISQKPEDSWKQGIGITENLLYLHYFILYLHPHLPHNPLGTLGWKTFL